VAEIASKFASADFQNFCRLAFKKSAERAVFFGLKGTLASEALFSVGANSGENSYCQLETKKKAFFY